MSSSNKLEGVNPNRMELLELRKRAKLAKHGHSLLKEKMDALIIEFYNAIEATKNAQKEALSAMGVARRSLIKAKLQMSQLELDDIASTAVHSVEINPVSRNIMGVRVANLNLEIIQTKPASYSMFTSTPALEEAVEENRKAVQKLIEYAEKMATLQRLAIEINKTKRRVNALNYIIIPKIENTARYIMLVLQELERENFTKLKHIKAKMGLGVDEQMEELEEEDAHEHAVKASHPPHPAPPTHHPSTPIHE